MQTYNPFKILTTWTGRSVRNKVAVSVLIIFGIIYSVASTFTYFNSKADLFMSASQEQLSTAQVIALNIYRDFLAPEEAAQEIQALIVTMKLLKKNLEEITIIGLDGSVISSTREEKIGTKPESEHIKNSLEKNKNFIEIFKDKDRPLVRVVAPISGGSGNDFSPTAAIVQVSNLAATLSILETNRNLTILSGLIVISVVFLAVFYLLTLTLKRPMSAIVGRVEQIAKGILNGEALKTTGRDEIGLLSVAMNKMSANLVRIITQIQTSNENLATSANESSTSANAISKAFEGQVVRTNDVATSVSEISQSIKQVAENAEEVNVHSEQSIVIAKAGNEKTKISTEGLLKVKEVMTDARNKLEELRKSSIEVGKTLDIIVDIAERTDLLALNAAIEAASAGEYGRGFSIVADEVRRLADRSMQAAAEIKVKTDHIESNIVNLNEAMDASFEAVVTSSKLSEESGAALLDVVSTLENTLKLAKQISYATSQQAAGSEEITKSIEEIAISGRESAAGVNQIASSAELLDTMASDLAKISNDFQL